MPEVDPTSVLLSWSSQAVLLFQRMRSRFKLRNDTAASCSRLEKMYSK